MPAPIADLIMAKKKPKHEKDSADAKSRKDGKKNSSSKETQKKKSKKADKAKKAAKDKSAKEKGKREIPEPAAAAADQDRSVGIGRDATGNAIISGDGNIVVVQNITQQAVPAVAETDHAESTSDIGPNPYKGLVSFDENDADRFYGREEQTRRLWALFRDLHEASSQPDPPLRLLPILGPSGSGKSSLARAGLIPELARRPLPGMKAARVAVLKPGTHPLEALAGVLARIATNDPTPVAKTRELARELGQTNAAGEYDGLRRIAGALPDIGVSPLIVFIDQFEELYSLCPDENERTAFVENLMHAVADRAGNVSAIATLRTDFLEETQQHDQLNSVIAQQGVIIPSMKEDELRRAITEPARRAGHPLDAATVDLLIHETQHREGALPLLQFALSRIWEGMANGVKPIDTLREIGGVGGALAQEAQRIYEALSDKDRQIARRVFLNLVQLGEGTRDTRRRAEIHSLIASGDDPRDVQSVIDRFSHSGARLITMSADTEGHHTAEVTHESLFEHWKLLDQWLDESRDDLRFQRRLDQAARHWQTNGQAEGLLWRPPDLDLALQYQDRAVAEMTPMQVDFVKAAEDRRNEEQRLARQRIRTVVSLTVSTAALLAFGMAVSVYAYFRTTTLLASEQLARQEADANFQNARKAVDDYLTKVSEETLLNQPGMQHLRRSLLEDSRRYHEEFLGQRADDPKLQIDVAASYHRLGLIDERLGERQQAIDNFQRAAKIQRKLAEEDSSDDKALNALGTTLVAHGSTLYAMLRFDEALEMFQQAFDVRKDSVAMAPENHDYKRLLANVQMNMGAAHQAKDEFSEALGWFQKAQDLREELLAKDEKDRRLRRDLATGHFNLGTLVFYQEESKSEPDFRAAQQHWRESVRSFEQLAEEDDSDLDTRYRLCTCYRLLGNAEESLPDALKLYNKAKTGLESLVRANFAVVKYRADLADLYLTISELCFLDTEDFQEALRASMQAVDLAEELVRDKPDELRFGRLLAQSLQLTGEVQQQLKQFSEARESYSRSVVCWDQVIKRSPAPEEDRADQNAVQELLKSVQAETE